MKKLLKLTLVVAAMLSSTTLYAQKFACINSQDVLLVMPETKEMNTNLEAFSKELQEQIEQIQVEFNNKYAEFEKGQATMSDAVKQMKQQELQQLNERYQQFQQYAQQDYQKKQQELLTPIQQKLTTAIEKVAKAGGYLAVFDTAFPTLAYFDTAAMVDLAPAVRKELGITDAPAAAPAK